MAEIILQHGQKQCFACGRANPMFTWTSSRHFPRHILAKIISNKTNVETKHVLRILESGVPVCVSCRRVLDEILH